MSASAIESILTLKRVYDVPVARLWRAWTDPKELGQWYVAGDDHVVHFCEADVRVGGTYRVGFGPPNAKPYVETGRYTEVTPLSRLSFEETVTNTEDVVVHTNLTIVDFLGLAAGKSQLAITSIGPHSWRTGQGWTPCMESLARYLAKAVS